MKTCSDMFVIPITKNSVLVVACLKMQVKTFLGASAGDHNDPG